MVSLYIFINSNNSIQYIIIIILAIFIHDFTEAETKHIKLDWSNIGNNNNYLEAILIETILSGVICYIFTFYFSNTIQQYLETPKSILFFLKPSYYHEKHKVKSELNDSKEGILIKDIYKTYNIHKKNEFKAVKGVNLEMKKNEIFALLGHNGAGKTTLLNMIIGSLTPDNGNIKVNGLNILIDKENIRKNLGVCPQFDILYDELTPLDHIMIYGGMKGISKKELIIEGDRLLKRLGLLVYIYYNNIV